MYTGSLGPGRRRQHSAASLTFIWLLVLGVQAYPQLPQLPLSSWSFAALLSDGSVQVGQQQSGSDDGPAALACSAGSYCRWFGTILRAQDRSGKCNKQLMTPSPARPS